jgi:hypothetical protein
MFTRALAIQEAAYSPKHPALALTLKHIEVGAAGTIAVTIVASQDQPSASNRRLGALGGFLQTIKEDDFKGTRSSMSPSR